MVHISGQTGFIKENINRSELTVVTSEFGVSNIVFPRIDLYNASEESGVNVFKNVATKTITMSGTGGYSRRLKFQFVFSSNGSGNMYSFKVYATAETSAGKIYQCDVVGGAGAYTRTQILNFYQPELNECTLIVKLYAAALTTVEAGVSVETTLSLDKMSYI